jgi:hypothetical protein
MAAPKGGQSLGRKRPGKGLRHAGGASNAAPQEYPLLQLRKQVFLYAGAGFIKQLNNNTFQCITAKLQAALCCSAMQQCHTPLQVSPVRWTLSSRRFSGRILL